MSLLKSFVTVGGATVASRILGFVRDAMIAGALGTGPVADAFVVAFRLPNLFRRLFAEGAFNSAFVPLYARSLKSEGEAGAARFAAEIASVLLILVSSVTALAMLIAPLLVDLLAVGFRADPAKFDLTVSFTRICFPYLACMSMAGLFGGILAAHDRFLLPSLAPVLLNLITIAALFVVFGAGLTRMPQSGLVLSVSVTVAGLAQVMLVVIGVWRAGLGFSWRLPRFTGSVRHLARLAVPGMLGGGVTQINIVIGTTIASMQAGAVSYLYYADRIYQLPLGIVGIAIGMVLLPEIVRRIRMDRDDLAIDSQNRSLELSMLLTIPAAIGLFVAARPIVEVLFEREAFGPRDTDMTSAALMGFALGLPAFVMVKVFSPAFFARLDMRTPMWIGIGVMLVNVAVSIALFPSLGHVGIALATSLAGWINAIALWAILVRRGEWRTDGPLETRLPRMLIAGLAMGLIVWVLGRVLEGWLGAENPLYIKMFALASLVATGVAGFAGIGLWIGAIDWHGLADALHREGPAERSGLPDVGFD